MIYDGTCILKILGENTKAAKKSSAEHLEEQRRAAKSSSRASEISREKEVNIISNN